jgi:peptidyl-prolyl cis-trans isomerase D
MLRFMRKVASKWVLGGFLALIIVAFVFGFGFNRLKDTNDLGKVGPYTITAYEYHDLYTKMESYYRMLLKGQLDEATRNELKLKDTALDKIVDKYLLLTKAKELGIGVSEKEIAENEAFKKDGKFDRATYEYLLRKNGVEPEQYEQDLIVSKMISVIQDNAPQADEKGAYAAYLKEKGQIKLAMEIFDPSEFVGKVSVDDKEIDATYQREKDTLKSENAFGLRYIAIGEKSGVKDDQAYMELLKSKDLVGYGKSKGIDVVDLGLVKEGELLKKFPKLPLRDSLKGMSKGDVTLPLRNGNDSYIFQLVDRQDGRPLTKEEASKTIRERIAREKAQILAQAKAEDAVKDKSFKFTKETGFLTRSSQTIPGIGPIPKEDADLLAISKGQTYAKTIAIDGKYYVFAYGDEKTPGADEWQKDKENFTRFYEATAKNSYLNAFKEDLKRTTKIKINRDLL